MDMDHASRQSLRDFCQPSQPKNTQAAPAPCTSSPDISRGSLDGSADRNPRREDRGLEAADGADEAAAEMQPPRRDSSAGEQWTGLLDRLPIVLGALEEFPGRENPYPRRQEGTPVADHIDICSEVSGDGMQIDAGADDQSDGHGEGDCSTIPGDDREAVGHDSQDLAELDPNHEGRRRIREAAVSSQPHSHLVDGIRRGRQFGAQAKGESAGDP